MEQNYSATAFPTAAATNNTGPIPAVTWSNPTRITANDGSFASFAPAAATKAANIVGSAFALPRLPANAVIDGLMLTIGGNQFNCTGDIAINVPGTTNKAILQVNGNYGGPTDLWGASAITLAQIAALTVTVNTISGGSTGSANIDYMTVTVYYHVVIDVAPADVPTRFAYKVYSRAGRFLGELPNVTSKFAFSQDINAAGSSITINCAQYAVNEVTVDTLLTEDSLPIQTESGLDLLSTSTNLVVARGDAPDEVLFKNSNRIKVIMYNYFYPNGKLMFSGQVNKLSLGYKQGDSMITLLVYSDGLDLDNLITRGYPFTYTNDQSQTSGASGQAIFENPNNNNQRLGQTWKTGAGVTNLGAITLNLNGTADVTLSVYDAPNGNLLGRVTQSVSTSSLTPVQFALPQLITMTPATTYFFSLRTGMNQYIIVDAANTNPYANGDMYQAANVVGTSPDNFAIGFGGYDLYFVTKSGVPTTTTTYNSQDPVTGMMRNILLDYNLRGGYVKENTFVAAGSSLSYTFNSATIYDAMSKILELAPKNYYSYIDLGTAKMDMRASSTTADFTVVRGKDISELDISLSIEQVENYLLLTGGDTGGGVNLFRQYPDAASQSNYGVRTSTKTDNRITVTATADAIGQSFIAENKDETQETTVTVMNYQMDTTKLTPGKTIGFRNFGLFVDPMVLIIARREWDGDKVKLTLGRLPVTISAEIQQIAYELENQQNIKNPSSPS